MAKQSLASVIDALQMYEASGNAVLELLEVDNFKNGRRKLLTLLQELESLRERQLLFIESVGADNWHNAIKRASKLARNFEGANS
jgi:hypothetical protein